MAADLHQLLLDHLNGKLTLAEALEAAYSRGSAGESKRKKTPKPFKLPTGPNQPKTKAEFARALGGDIKAMQDPYVQQMMAALPEKEE